MILNSTSFWKDRSLNPGLRAVLDPADRYGIKNAYIDYMQKQTVGRMLKKTPPVGKILDFGCGIGRMTAWISQRLKRDVIGYDSEESMLLRARKLVPNVQFIQDLAACRPGVTGVFTLWVLQHIIFDSEVTDIFASLMRANDIKWILLYEKTSTKSEIQSAAPGEPPYQITRSVRHYGDFFARLGFVLNRVAINDFRHQGIVSHVILPGIRSRRWIALFPLFSFVDFVYCALLRTRHSPRGERDTCMLFLRA